MLKKKNYYIPRVENIIVGEDLLSSFEIENLKLEVLLYQTGYLTIQEEIEKRNRIEYKLTVPNLEVQMSLNNLFIDYLTSQDIEKYSFQNEIYDCLEKEDLECFKNSLILLFSSIPYNNYIKNKIGEYEGYYASVIYAYLASLGLKIIAEDVTNNGRVDLTLFLDNKIYIIEFKVIDKRKEENVALEQLIKKRYYQKYLAFKTENIVYLIGIEFSSSERNIINFKWKKLTKNNWKDK